MSAERANLTDTLRAALGEIESTWQAKWYPPSPESVERAEHDLEAALGLVSRITEAAQVIEACDYVGGCLSCAAAARVILDTCQPEVAS